MQPNAHECKQQHANINTFRLQNTVQRNSVGIYSPRSRRKRIDRYLAKRKTRVWVKRVKYDVRKNFADSRLRGMFLLFFIKMYILVNVIIYIYTIIHTINISNKIYYTHIIFILYTLRSERKVCEKRR